MLNYSNKSSPNIRNKSTLCKKLLPKQQKAVRLIFLSLNWLNKRIKNKLVQEGFIKIKIRNKECVRFFCCVQSIRLKILNNAFNEVITLKKLCKPNNKSHNQLLNYPSVLIYRLLNQNIKVKKQQTFQKLIQWKLSSKLKHSNITKIKFILTNFAIRSFISHIFRNKIKQQLKMEIRQARQPLILFCCQKQSKWILSKAFNSILNVSLNNLICDKNKQRTKKRQQRQLYNTKRNQSIIFGKNKLSQLKAQLQQSQTVIHKKRQYGKYQNSIIINKKNQQYKKMETNMNYLNSQTETLKLGLQKKIDSINHRHLGIVQIKKVFQLFEFIKNSEQEVFELKHLKLKIDQNMLNRFQKCKQNKCVQGIMLQNIIRLYEGRTNQSKGQTYVLAVQQNQILKNILSSLINLQHYRRLNNSQVKNVLNELQQTTSNLQLIRRKHSKPKN